MGNESKMKFKEIKLKDIEQNENSRTAYKDADLHELMTSMRKTGLLQPIGVRLLPGGKFDSVWGNRRIIAARKLGWDLINAHIVDIDTELDRDLVGQIENMKRKDTTVAEEGRMYKSYLDRGMTINEIAARLDVSAKRVENALDVDANVPEDFRNKIVYSPGGKQKAKTRGLIPASTASAIMGMRKKHKLNSAQTRSLLQKAAEGGLNLHQVSTIAPMLSDGTSVDEAIEQAASVKSVLIYVYVKEADIERLEKKYKKALPTLFREFLEKNKEFRLLKKESNHLHLRRE